MLEDGLAAALAEEDFVADEDIDRTQLARFDLGDEAVGLGEGPHQKPSRILGPACCEIARQAFQRGRVFFEEAVEVASRPGIARGNR